MSKLPLFLSSKKAKSIDLFNKIIEVLKDEIESCGNVRKIRISIIGDKGIEHFILFPDNVLIED